MTEQATKATDTSSGAAADNSANNQNTEEANNAGTGTDAGTEARAVAKAKEEPEGGQERKTDVDIETEWREFSDKYISEKINDVELISKADIKSFTPVARELGLNTAQASKLVSFVQDVNRKVLEKQIDEFNGKLDKYEADLRADKDFSGADGKKFDENLKLSIVGMKKLLGDNAEAIKLMENSELGSHPAVVKGFLKIGLMEKEGATLGANTGINNRSNMSVEQRLEEYHNEELKKNGYI